MENPGESKGLSWITGLLPECPLAVGAIISWIYGKPGGRLDMTMFREQWYWYVGAWAVLRVGRAARRPVVRREIKKLTAPLRMLLHRFSWWVINSCFVPMEWDELLDYLSGNQFDPIVMCAAYGSGQRLRNSFGQDGRKECQRHFCRFGAKPSIPPGIDKSKVPGSRSLSLGVWDALSGVIRLEGVGIEQPLTGQLVVRPHLLSLRQRRVEVDISRLTRPGAGNLLIASSTWDTENYLEYGSAGLAIPRHAPKHEPINKSEDWWQKAVRSYRS
jgi:hypothetical protein